MKKKDKKLKGISRIDSKSTHGWYVRIYGIKSVFACKLFSDRLYGGKKAALKNAIVYRDHNQMVADLQIQRVGQGTRGRTEPMKHNKSGVAGVHKSVNRKKNGYVYYYYRTTWFENGKSRSKEFIINKNRPEEVAFQMAVALRKEKERTVYHIDQAGSDKTKKK